MRGIMTTPRHSLVSTSLGRLHVQRGTGAAGPATSSTGAAAPATCSTGPTAILWHSLFIDSRSWGPLIDALSRYRSVIAIDGPSHGKSEAVGRDFSYAECVTAAAEALDGLGISEPVDWVGNAWGGHVGLQLAAADPHRIRTLTTIGTPVQSLSARERWTMAWPLVQLYRVAGPTGFLTEALSDALMGPEAVAAQPDQAADIIDSFRSADRRAMFHAMRSMMLHRPHLGPLLPRITAPTLMLAARDDAMGWQPSDAQAAVAGMPDARAGVVAGTGHVSPLLLDADLIEESVIGFWNAIQRA
jgi:pimeloyl-ACP methyl ester carboxylesterase